MDKQNSYKKREFKLSSQATVARCARFKDLGSSKTFYKFHEDQNHKED
jgi:hypothetical protein